MTRELSNKMYSPLAYYLGRLVSQLIVQVVPPAIMFGIITWGLKIDESTNNLMWLFALNLVGNFVWSAMGFFIGLVISDEGDGAKLVSVTLCMIFIALNGNIVNPDNTVWIM